MKSNTFIPFLHSLKNGTNDDLVNTVIESFDDDGDSRRLWRGFTIYPVNNQISSSDIKNADKGMPLWIREKLSNAFKQHGFNFNRDQSIYADTRPIIARSYGNLFELIPKENSRVFCNSSCFDLVSKLQLKMISLSPKHYEVFAYSPKNDDDVTIQTINIIDDEIKYYISNIKEFNYGDVLPKGEIMLTGTWNVIDPEF